MTLESGQRAREFIQIQLIYGVQPGVVYKYNRNQQEVRIRQIRKSQPKLLDSQKAMKTKHDARLRHESEMIHTIFNWFSSCLF